MYQTTNLLCIMLIFIGIFGVPSDASPFRKFPSNKEGGYLRDAPATAEDLYKLLDKLEVAIQDVAADVSSNRNIFTVTVKQSDVYSMVYS